MYICIDRFLGVEREKNKIMELLPCGSRARFNSILFHI